MLGVSTKPLTYTDFYFMYLNRGFESLQKVGGHKNFQPKNFSNRTMLSLWYEKGNEKVALDPFHSDFSKKWVGTCLDSRFWKKIPLTMHCNVGRLEHYFKVG